MKLDTDFILASGSPRRRKLLEQIGLSFTVEVSDVEEVFEDHHTPEEIVRNLALEKAKPVAARHPNALTLGADTIVVLDGTVLGKPADPLEAERMLASLSGKTHIVYTGIALVHPTTNRAITAFETTGVTFAEMALSEIRSYVATGSPLDKAGAYGIQDDQGALYVSRIDGDYYNVVGLPLHRLYHSLKQYFSDLVRMD